MTVSTHWLQEKQELRIPGPTPVPPSVLRAMSRPMINHRGPEFKAILARVTERLQRLVGTEQYVAILTGSGTAGMEAACANLVSPGDRVLVLEGASSGTGGWRSPRPSVPRSR
ncbi:MAG: alanine--glyoxylate aminotransferase family protein [Limnochordaceae bacterium]|nr:alanine--glyoxylate aminotransferase family protein [Limnochordaceae bacterium]